MDAGAWIAAALGLTAWLVLLSAALCLLLGMLLASAGGMPRWAGGLVGALGGPIGLAVLAVVALVRRGRDAAVATAVPAPVTPVSAAPPPAASRPPRRFRLRRLDLVLLIVVAAGLVAALALDSVQVSAAGITVFALPVLGTGLDVLALLTLLPLAGVAALLGWGATRWAAALAATVAAGWLALLGAIVALWLPLRAALEQATTAGGTVGDALGMLGLTVDGVGVSLPEGGLFALLGLSGRRFELAGVDLAAVIPHLGLGLGTGILALIAAALCCAAIAGFALRRGTRIIEA